MHAHHGERCQGIVHRSRTTPQSSADLAFFAPEPTRGTDLGPLADQRGLLASCVRSDGFRIPGR